MVLLSNITPDSLIRLNISKSNAISNNEFPEFIEFDDIELIENGLIFTDFTFDNFQKYDSPQYVFNKKPCLGCEYTIKVKDENFDNIESTTHVPSTLLDLEFKLTNQDSVTIRDQFGLVNYYDFESQINSPLFNTPEKKFFHIKIWKETANFFLEGNDTIVYNTYIEDLAFSIADDIPRLELLHESGILINGKDLAKIQNGLNINFSLQSIPEEEIKSPIFVELRIINEDYFRFHKSLAEQERNAFNSAILANQAVPIYNNIKNGLGNFSAYLTERARVIWY